MLALVLFFTLSWFCSKCTNDAQHKFYGEESSCFKAVRMHLESALLRKSAGCFLVVALTLVVFYNFFVPLRAKTPQQQHVGRSTPTYSNLGECYFLANKDTDRLICPDIRQKGNKTQRQAELVLARILRVFDLIAKKYGVRYWLYKGTLLGAVRHKGHNPFDNDADVAVLREDYEMFISKGAKMLPDDMFLQTEESDSHWQVVPRSNMLGKIRDTKSCYNYCSGYGCKHHNGLMLDIFVVDQDDKGVLLEAYSYRYWLFRYLFGPLRTPYSYVFPLAQMDFDGFYFPVPNQWDKVLAARYGSDYMKMPTSRDRFALTSVHPLSACTFN